MSNQQEPDQDQKQEPNFIVLFIAVIVMLCFIYLLFDMTFAFTKLFVTEFLKEIRFPM